MLTTSTQRNAATKLIPLVIGVTGHRDLVEQEVDRLESCVVDLISSLQRRFPHTPIRIVSALAEGADRLVARVALKCDVELQVVLPMPAQEYKKDFGSTGSKAEFDALCEQAEVLTLAAPAQASGTGEIVGQARNICYANVGMFISAHCHILLALWDGVHNDNLGGTSQIIYFHHYDRLPGLSESVPRSSLFLTDDESDLVYHISCSRRFAHDAAVPPLQHRWYTTAPDTPASTDMPERYINVFRRGDEYNGDIRRLLDNSDASESAEIEAPDIPRRAAAERIRSALDVADSLANHFQKRVSTTLVGLYSFAIFAGLAFILYSELSGFDLLIYAFLAFLLLNIVLATVAKKRGWHRKYLDYRVLAEGLRVQYYRAIASILAEGHTKFAYDNFLRQRDMELGWIRNVMRVAGALADAQVPDADDKGLQFAIRRWIGTEQEPGQLRYYQVKAERRARANNWIDRFTMACLWGGIIAACLLAFFLRDVTEMRGPLILLMGVLPLIAGVAEAYTQRKADRELIKQYQFMRNVFSNALERLNAATSDSERREILQGLGDAALSEHAEWILVHRERQPESTAL